MKEDVLSRNQWRLMAEFSVHGVISAVLIGVQNFVDAVAAGQFIGESAFSAISIAFPLTLILSGAAHLIGVGSASIYSRAIGAGDRETQRTLLENSFFLTIVASGICSLFWLAFGEDATKLIGAENQILEESISYLSIIFIGSIFSISGITFNMLLRARGEIRLATIFTGIAVSLNIALNFIFSGLFKFGIKGIAVATVLSMLSLSILSVRHLLKTSGYTTRPNHQSRRSYFKVINNYTSEIAAIGMSAMFVEILVLFQHGMIFSSISQYGEQKDIAFMGACLKVFLLGINISSGFANSFQPIAGINYGGGKNYRVKESFFIFSFSGFVCLLSLWLVVQSFPQQTINLMLPSYVMTEQDLTHFRLATFLIPAFPFTLTALTLFQVIGNSFAATTVVLCRQVILFFPVMLILRSAFGITGIYISLLIVDVLVITSAALLSFIEIRRMTNNKSSYQENF